MGNWVMMSSVDVKGAFNNIPIHEDSRPYCGIVTQDDVLEYIKMTFGFTGAPCLFQFTIVDALETPEIDVPAPPHATYLDDCTTGATAQDPESDEPIVLRVWRHTLAVMWRLAYRGLPVNLWKCNLLCRKLNVLGVVLFERKYQLGRKALQRLIASELPRTLK